MSGTNGDSKKGTRDHAREVARQAREQEKKRQRRNHLFVQGGIGLGVVAIIVVVIVLIVNQAAPTVTVSPKNMQAGGIVFEGSSGVATAQTAPASTASQTASPAGLLKSTNVPHVVTFIDWSCPICKQFEATYSSKLEALVASGKATLEIHPIAILDTHYLSSGYSTRAANAAACVANYEPSKFLAAQTEFYDHQPTEGTNGLTNAQILTLLKDAGVTFPSMASCVDDETFKNWVTATTDKVDSESSLINPSTGYFGTPTVFINGKLWGGTTDLMSDIAAAG